MSGTTPKYSSVDPNILDKVQTEIECLHATFERRGVNSRGQTDIYGRPFNCSVDAEHKANKFNTMMLLSVEQPHMRALTLLEHLTPPETSSGTNSNRTCCQVSVICSPPRSSR